MDKDNLQEGINMPDWPFDLEVDGIYYKHIRDTNEITVTNSMNNRFEYRGDFIIPRKVTYREREYLVTEIGDDAFYHSAIFSIDIPDSITRIGDYAFHGCSALRDITIPQNVVNIGDFAFIYCSGLKTIRVEASVPPICGENTFKEISKDCKLFVSENSKEAYQKADGWKNFLI